MVLLHNSVNNSLIPVIRAAILGSILANLLLCLGFCFFAGGLRRNEQEFDEVISEVGNGQLLMAGFGLLIPSAYYTSLRGSVEDVILEANVLHISRTTSVILLIAFLMQEALTPALIIILADVPQIRMVSDAHTSWPIRRLAREGRRTRCRPAFRPCKGQTDIHGMHRCTSHCADLRLTTCCVPRYDPYQLRYSSSTFPLDHADLVDLI